MIIFERLSKQMGHLSCPDHTPFIKIFGHAYVNRSAITTFQMYKLEYLLFITSNSNSILFSYPTDFDCNQ